ncbi:hypothetical protein NY_014-179 [NY_014 poxvirus]|uniref:hypothetical protein n=1 Tax=NY_014 poxvirus TaxID=2025360 RepID=UPI000B99FBE4|nr:hypothetical protein CKM51_gp179 [NY_014 poxvirus]AST09580.1 hypothetical protein NY_014-179 [NY_014 poxvirus]
MSSASYNTHDVFSPLGFGDRLIDVNDTKQCLVEYMYWSSYPFRSREAAGTMYSKFLSFRQDAESVFGSVRNVVMNMPWDNVEDCVAIVRCYVKDNMKTAREAAAIVGLCAYAATYWIDDDRPSERSLNALFVMLELFNYADYMTIYQRIQEN